ncbi:MAG: arylsulfatase A, partial [bacterium]|nr:arylsulfatase A [bacterium]
GLKDNGTHVPLVAFWKGRTPQGKVDESLIEFTDFYPTLAELAGVQLGQDDPVDGMSFYPQLTGNQGRTRDWLVCHYQPYWNKPPGQFIRNQQYKLYRDGRFYDIGSGDLEEARNLTPEVASETANRNRQGLQSTMDRLPPAPVGIGTRDSVERPTYPDWPNLLAVPQR